MISIQTGERRDIGLNNAGNLAFAEGMDAIAQNCVTAISAQAGEMVFAADEGIPTLASVWDQYRPAIFEAAARRTLLAVEGVREVVDFRQRREGGVLTYSVRILTDFGTTTFTV